MSYANPLTDGQKADIYRRLGNGEKYRVIAEDFGISVQRVQVLAAKRGHWRTHGHRKAKRKCRCCGTRPALARRIYCYQCWPTIEALQQERKRTFRKEDWLQVWPTPI